MIGSEQQLEQEHNKLTWNEGLGIISSAFNCFGSHSYAVFLSWDQPRYDDTWYLDGCNLTSLRVNVQALVCVQLCIGHNIQV